jgi:soluble lytic murein transglycosylase-like protein
LKQFCFRLGLASVLACSVLACSLVAADRVTVVHADLKSGKLVRSAVVASKPVTPKVVAPVEVGAQAPAAAAVADRLDLGLGINAVVESIAAQHSLPPQLIHSVIQVESNYNPNAVSPKGAQGLMQLIPATARRFGVSDAFDPVANIEGGAKYLKYLLDLYNNDYRLALAAYNAGEAAVAKYGDVPPFAETRNYVVQVGRRLEQAQKAAAAQKQKEVKTVEVKPDTPRMIQQVVEADGTVRYVAR